MREKHRVSGRNWEEHSDQVLAVNTKERNGEKARTRRLRRSKSQCGRNYEHGIGAGHGIGIISSVRGRICVSSRRRDAVVVGGSRLGEKKLVSVCIKISSALDVGSSHLGK